MTAPERTIEIVLPGAVWSDALDPAASGMQAELGLPVPSRRRRGRGTQVVYPAMPTSTALELAEYLEERGETLLGQGFNDDGAERDALRAGIRAAEKIRAEVRA